MHTAQITTWGATPEYKEVPDLPIPDAATSNLVQIKVTATGLNGVVRARASGTHYSSGSLPHVPGSDGTGATADGQAVYFSAITSGGATFADFVNVDKHQVFPLPAGLDPVKAAALLNPATSSWMALRYRVSELPKPFTVLVVGATSASGQLAITNARLLGAAKVYGAARNVSKLVSLGLDRSFSLNEYDGGLEDVNVILDYVSGDSLSPLLEALPATREIQYVHIGVLGGSGVSPLDGSMLRSKNITIRGAGPGAWNPEKLAIEMPEILNSLKYSADVAIEKYDLSEVERYWNIRSAARQVFCPNVATAHA